MRLNTKRVITEAINTTLSGGAIEALSGYIEHVKAVTHHGTLNSGRQNVINAFREKFRDSDDVYNIWKDCTPDSFDDIACERCEERYGDDYTDEQFEEELKRVMYADFLSGLNNFQCDKRGYLYVVRDMLIPRNATKEAFSEYGDGFGVCWSGFETSKPDVPYNKEKQVRIRVYALAPAESIEYEYSVFSFVGASE